MDNQTHFGFKTVDESEKAGKVAEVFHSVAQQYKFFSYGDAMLLTRKEP